MSQARRDRRRRGPTSGFRRRGHVAIWISYDIDAVSNAVISQLPEAEQQGFWNLIADGIGRYRRSPEFWPLSYESLELGARGLTPLAVAEADVERVREYLQRFGVTTEMAGSRAHGGSGAA